MIVSLYYGNELLLLASFLDVKRGDIVLVRRGPRDNCWIGRVVHVVSGPRDSSINSIFQIVDLDTGLVKTLNADLVEGIICSLD